MLFITYYAPTVILERTKTKKKNKWNTTRWFKFYFAQSNSATALLFIMRYL